MPSVSVVSSAAPLRADAVVVGVHADGDGFALAPGAEPVDAALGGRLFDGLRAVGATGRPDEVHRLATFGLSDVPVVLATGLGAATDDPGRAAEAARRGVGAALRAARSITAVRRVHLALDAPAGALAEGALLGAYAFTDFKSAAPASPLRTITLAGAGADKTAVRRAAVVAEAVALVRDLVNTPPNHLYPETFAQRAAEHARAHDLEVEVLDEKALKKGRYGGILGVGQGSVRPPRLVRISYRPTKAAAHLALVGKGITFDSGGLNLKTAAGMLTMKSDMGGAAAMIASVAAIAALKLPVRVTATVPMAENMPSGSSYRPSDVLRMYDGTTVEVNNTDAEGRLVLADGITRAAQDDPDYLIEASTLTGAQVVALGNRVIAAMGSDDWRDTVAAAGSAAGEDVWSMPLTDDLRGRLDSPVADMTNVSGDRAAGMLIAGGFLASFVPDGLPWVHLDIAGPSWHDGTPYGYTAVGGTGAGVRTVIAAAERLTRG